MEDYRDEANEGENIGVPPTRAVCTFCGQFIALASRQAKINVCPRCDQHTMTVKCINSECQEKIPYPFEGRNCLACGQNLFVAGVSLVTEHLEPTAEERKALTEKRDQHWVDEVKQQAVENFKEQQVKEALAANEHTKEVKEAWEKNIAEILSTGVHHHDCPQCQAPCFDANTFCVSCNETMGQEEMDAIPAPSKLPTKEEGYDDNQDEESA